MILVLNQIKIVCNLAEKFGNHRKKGCTIFHMETSWFYAIFDNFMLFQSIKYCHNYNLLNYLVCSSNSLCGHKYFHIDGNYVDRTKWEGWTRCEGSKMDFVHFIIICNFYLIYQKIIQIVCISNACKCHHLHIYTYYFVTFKRIYRL